MNTIWIAVGAPTLSVWCSAPFAIPADSRLKMIRLLKNRMRFCRRVSGQCGYPGCRPYAEAVGLRGEKINRCMPGGEAVMLKWQSC